MSVLVAVLTLYTAPILGLGAIAAVVTFSVAVSAALNARLRALRDVVAGLETVEAGATSTTASAWLWRLWAVHLAVSEWDQ